MSETWKGKTRGGIFDIFFIYDPLFDNCGLRLPGIGRPLYFIPSHRKQRAILELRTKQGRNTDERNPSHCSWKTITGWDKHDWQSGHRQRNDRASIIQVWEPSGIFRRTKRKHRSNYDYAHVGNWEIGAPFFDEYKINIVMFDAEHER